MQRTNKFALNKIKRAVDGFPVYRLFLHPHQPLAPLAHMIGEVELSDVEQYLLQKSVEDVATPVKAELVKLRQQTGHHEQQHMQAVLSSPRSDLSYSSTAVNVASSPGGEFKRGMAIYRPGSKSVLSIVANDALARTPPTPLMDPSEKKRLRRIEELNSALSSTASPIRKLLFPVEHGSGPREREADEKKLASRQKQIDYGKNTIGYARYLEAVPRSARKHGDPWTPDKLQICSKRSWDGQVRKWRRVLHKYDPDDLAALDADSGSDTDSPANFEEESNCSLSSIPVSDDTR